MSAEIFVDNQGEKIKFLLPSVHPTASGVQENIRIKELIEEHGGLVQTSKAADSSAINLVHVEDKEAAVRAASETSETFYLSSYVDDCVQERRRLNLDDYAIKRNLVVKIKRPYHQYTPDEDARIVQYVESHSTNGRMVGNESWKEAERSLGMPHTWQSLKDRYIRHIQPSCAKKRLSEPLVNNSGQLQGGHHQNSAQLSTAMDPATSQLREENVSDALEGGIYVLPVAVDLQSVPGTRTVVGRPSAGIQFKSPGEAIMEVDVPCNLHISSSPAHLQASSGTLVQDIRNNSHIVLDFNVGTVQPHNFEGPETEEDGDKQVSSPVRNNCSPQSAKNLSGQRDINREENVKISKRRRIKRVLPTSIEEEQEEGEGEQQNDMLSFFGGCEPMTQEEQGNPDGSAPKNIQSKQILRLQPNSDVVLEDGIIQPTQPCLEKSAYVPEVIVNSPFESHDNTLRETPAAGGVPLERRLPAQMPELEPNEVAQNAAVLAQLSTAQQRRLGSIQKKLYHLAIEFNCSQGEVLSAVVACSGDISAARSLLNFQTGCGTSNSRRAPACWEDTDDKNLLACHNTKGVPLTARAKSQILAKYGQEAMAARLRFLLSGISMFKD